MGNGTFFKKGVVSGPLKKNNKSPECWVFKGLTIVTNHTHLLCHFSVALMWPPLHWQYSHKSLPGSGTMAILTCIQWMSQHRNYTNIMAGVPPSYLPTETAPPQKKKLPDERVRTGHPESRQLLLRSVNSKSPLEFSRRVVEKYRTQPFLIPMSRGSPPSLKLHSAASSASDPDPDWIKTADPDSESGSGSRRAKNDPHN